MMSFMGVTVSNFNSMFRRGFIWKAKARFVHSKFLANYSDHQKDGIFASDPSLSKFLSTSQASIAGLRMQWAFERTHTKDTCYQLTEDYSNGGDQYLTEDVMRAACGIPVRQRQFQDTEGINAALAAEVSSQDERDEKDTAWERLRVFIFQTMLDATMEVMSYTEFKKLSFKQKDTPNLPKEKLWDQIEEQGVVRQGIVKHKTSKVKPGSFIPKITLAKDFRDLCQPLQDSEVRMIFEEEHDVHSLRQYAFRHGARKSNADVLEQYHTESIRALSAAKPGKKTVEQTQACNKHQSSLDSIREHENSIMQVLNGGACAAKRRRLRPRESLTEDERVEGVRDSQAPTLTSRQITYHYPDASFYSITPRRYSGLGSAQKMSRGLQVHVLEGHTADLDIKNCCLTLTYQILGQLKPSPPLPGDLASLLDEITHRRSDFVKRLGVCDTEGKEILNALVNGGAIPPHLRNNESAQKLQRLSLYLRWVACNLLHDDYMKLKDSKQKQFPSATTFSLMWHAVEDRILQAWTEHILATQTKPSHLSLHFDGVRVSRNVMEEAQRYIESCQKAIKEKTSFDVVIVEKKAKDFMSHVREQSTQKVEIRHLPDACTLVGNCIPCALWHIAPLLRLTITSSIQNHELSENTEALKRRWRTYRSAAALYKTDLMCSVGLPADDVLSYILHYEGNGCPHCVAVQVLADRQNVMVVNGRTSMKLSMLAFREAFAAAVDRSTVVTYWQRRSRGELADKTGHLPDMQAGADISSDDEAANDEVCTARFSFDEDNKPVVSDNIQQTLRREVEETLLDLRLGHKE